MTRRKERIHCYEAGKKKLQGGRDKKILRSREGRINDKEAGK